MSTITSHTIYQRDVKVTCKCGAPMKFGYMEFAMSSFECTNCNATFVHDDWNEPNEDTCARRMRERAYDKKEEAGYC